MKDLKEFILEKRIRELKVDGKKVPDKYIAVFNDYLVEIAELIKTHDREFVKEVCEKVREMISTLNPNVKIEENNYDVITGHGLKMVFDQIQKEFEK